MTHCPRCGNRLTPEQEKESQQKYLITHTSNHVEHIDECIVHDDAFFEIMSGNRKGNFIHRWNANNISKR